MRRRALAVLVLGVSVGCVGPAPSFDMYASKAGDTAQGMLSAVDTGRAAVTLASRRLVFDAYLSVTIAGAEESARSVEEAFNSIQPPDQESDLLRRRLDIKLNRSVEVLTELRIAIRRGELDRLPQIAAPLARLATRLDRFAKEHP